MHLIRKHFNHFYIIIITMKYYYIIVLFSICLWSACKKTSDEHIDDHLASHISIDVSNIEFTMKASELFSKVDFIPLETNDVSLIGSIDKLLIYGQRYFIMDKQTLSVMIFSDKGQFIHKISKPGNGPDEYTTLYNLFIDEKNKWFIMDTDTKLFYYHLDSYELIEAKKKYHNSDVAYLGNNTFAYYLYDNPNVKNSLVVERELLKNNFSNLVGEENICKNIHEALAKANEILND